MAHLALEDRDRTDQRYHCALMLNIKPGTQSVLSNCMVHEWTITHFWRYVQSHPRNTG